MFWVIWTVKNKRMPPKQRLIVLPSEYMFSGVEPPYPVRAPAENARNGKDQSEKFSV